jgi:hypothetical protein
MASIDQKSVSESPRDEMAATAPKFPQLRLPNQEVADSGIVRLGNGMITATFPELRLPNQEIADRGIVRLGNGMITAVFPSNSAWKLRSTRS